MNDDKAAILVNTIMRRTEEGRIPWTATSTENAFEASFPKNTLRIVKEEGVDRETGEDYSVVRVDILDITGRTIDSIYPYTVRKQVSKPWEATEGLFNRAREQALGINEAVDGLLSELGGAVPLDKGKGDDLEDEIPF